MPDRFGTHYDSLPHGNCGDEDRCDCECTGCMEAWRRAGKPGPVKGNSSDGGGNLCIKHRTVVRHADAMCPVCAELDSLRCDHCDLTYLPGVHKQEDCPEFLLNLLDDWYQAQCLDIDPAQGIGVEQEVMDQTLAVLTASGRYRRVSA